MVPFRVFSVKQQVPFTGVKIVIENISDLSSAKTLTDSALPYSAGASKDASLVYDAFATVKANLGDIQMFHTDRGSEFNNKLIDEIMEIFSIKRSLSLKGCPFDNAVAESTFKIFKAEFVRGRNFASLERLKLELGDYINWLNNFRLHSSLGYLSPSEFNAKTL